MLVHDGKMWSYIFVSHMSASTFADLAHSLTGARSQRDMNIPPFKDRQGGQFSGAEGESA